MNTDMPRRQALRLMGVAAGAAGVTVAGAGAAAAEPVDAAVGTPQPQPLEAQLRGGDPVYSVNARGVGLLGAQVDEWVLQAQRWVNRTYGGTPGYVPAPETGRTGWSTMFALTRALQIEVGLSGDQLSDTFGPTTLSLLTQRFGDIDPGEPANVVRIVQSGLYCKGYWGESLSGRYGVPTGDSVAQMRSNMGFADSRRTLAPKEFRALLTMDAYVLVENGSATVRSVQQWMNRKYYDQSWFTIIPCDGHSSRDVAKALIYAVQTELGVAGANGNYGPGTRGAVKAKAPIRLGAADSGSASYVRLFQAGMIFNRYEVPFDGVFATSTQQQVFALQQFLALPGTGVGDYQTWSSLLASNGDPERKGTAADCVSEVTAARAAALKQAGYQVVGRYLTNVPNTTLDKKIRPGELATIFAAGLRVFPIYQTYGGSAAYFTDQQGAADASTALDAATAYGFERGTTVYFAVDYDALDSDITDSILPYFRGVNRAMGYFGNPYRVGVYGARNVCGRVDAEHLATTSFVSDMSTGFSGNLGFTMPRNWAFDQIATTTVGGVVEIDNDISSGRDTGVSRVVARTSPNDRLDVRFSTAQTAALGTDLENYAKTVTSNTIGLKHSVRESLDVVVAYDELITNLSRSYGVRKAVIQSEVCWEYWKETPQDNVSDGLVVSWYAYQEAYEAWQSVPVGPAPTPPAVAVDDCSTGIAQIFAATAIRGRNWAVGQGLIPDAPVNGGDWHKVWDTWKQLHDNGNYNISTVPLVLFEGGSQVGVTGRRLDYTEVELKKLFARYNGTGAPADLYGRELYGMYLVFEGYNARLR
ncbi:glycoside hydrolase domain-containing protein [Actinokineospora inagensis]|uniref:glycoside hydrolase domain-containing protein n=1 Tax=Actinokineospora inagensis TaxID=103730 RepID=UPI001FDF479B|nr:glycoside hydrolase domain-containing protein [Actinokineospora inagensis]